MAAWFGSALEYYDFAIYGTAAALVFPDIFFPEGNDTANNAAAFATFGVAYVARPIGSFLMGHIGDRVGRKKVMIGTILMMGISTFLVGCLPTYQQVGLLAPVLLVVLRLVQGLSASGEQAGANSMSFEHAPDDRRGLLHQLHPQRHPGRPDPGTGDLPAARCGARRRPAAVVGMADPVLDQCRRGRGRARHPAPPGRDSRVPRRGGDRGRVPGPLTVLFSEHRAGVLRVFFAAFIATVNTMFAVFALNLATSDDYDIGISETTMLWLAIVANLVAIAVIPLWARLSDRIGRKPVFITGALGSAALGVVFFGAIAHGQVALMFVSGVALAGVVYSMPNAVWPATYAEYFPTSVRLSGMAIGTQFGFALAGFTPTIASALIGSDSSNWVRVALFMVVTCAISAIAVGTGPRATHRVATGDLGRSVTPQETRRIRVNA